MARLSNERLRTALADAKGGAYWVIVDGALHSNFSDEPYLSAKPEEEDRRVKVTQATREYLRAFFDQALLGKNSPLLQPGAPAKEGIGVEIFPKS